MKKEIHKVCQPCGISANILTCLKKYKSPPYILSYRTITWHKAKCDICGKKSYVSEPRDFYYPNFDLLLKKMKKNDQQL